MIRRFLVLALVPALLPACEAPSARTSREMSAALSSADWQRAEDVKIELRDSGFIPGELRLRVGRPYRLLVVNTGVNNHYLNAPEFFGSIAALKAEVPRHAEVMAPRFSKFEIASAGGHIELWFVPLAKGRYRVHCHLGNHAEMGVEGFVLVE